MSVKIPMITKSNTEVIILKQFLTRGSTQSVQKISPRKFISSLKLYKPLRKIDSPYYNLNVDFEGNLS